MVRVVSLLLFFVAVCLSGCSRDRGMEKVVVDGTVKYAGKPVANGDIKFYPIAGTPGPVSGAPIKDGRYVVKNKDGVPVGEHMVRIRAFDVSNGNSDDDLITMGQKEAAAKSARRQFIPEKYNTKTELQVEVSRKKRTVDFDLEE